ncbi:MAG: hypothetical protein R3Y35_04585 [Clostridia bacterium]
MEEYQTSFFSEEMSTIATPVAKKLDVAKLEFVNGETLTWKELFAGFDTIHAITYSSGIGFISKLLELFDSAEIIFGCEQVMSYSLNEVMAYQLKLIERIRSNNSKDYLISRIQEETLHLLVARDKLSHEKIYLLSSESGRKRVVMGSANMSEQAFSGHQRENISCIDGDEAYEWYMSVYNSLKEDCTDEITEKAIVASDDTENIDELPISKTIKINKVLTIISDKNSAEEVEFALDVSNLANKIKPLQPKADKTGKILLSPTSIVSMRNLAKEAHDKEKEIRKEYPRLIVNVDNCSAHLNDVKLDLNPSLSEVKNDVDLFLQYMDGYKNFHGEYKYMQQRYFEFANWFFCSPFMGVMRDMAHRYNQNTLPYPIFGLVYGQSKAGKTSFLETLLKMMIGKKTRISAPEFTRRTIDALRYEVKGAPIIVDDLTQKRFTDHAIETIKNDAFGIADKMIHYPAVVISANEDVKAVAPEIIRRTVICRVQAGLTNTEVMRSSVVRKVQKNIGTAFYREYLRRMFECIPEMVESIKDDEIDSAPDILKISSEIICDILAQNNNHNLPDYIRKLSLNDYFSERVTGKHAIQTIKSAWRTSRKCFVINKSANEIRYNAGQSYDADRIIKELPETLEIRKSREWVIMNLKEARKFFDEDFKITFVEQFKHR